MVQSIFTRLGEGEEKVTAILPRSSSVLKDSSTGSKDCVLPIIQKGVKQHAQIASCRSLTDVKKKSHFMIATKSMKK